MILSDFFIQVNSCFRGSDDDAPATGTTDWDLWLATTVRKISDWARDPYNTWKSLFRPDVTVGTVVAGTQSYNLSATILMPSDKLIVTKTDGQNAEFTIVEPQERNEYANAVYISGDNPQVLTFVDPIAAGNPLVGGTIKLSGYFLPTDPEDEADTIPVDDPYWLVYAVAAELAFNDLTYNDKYGDLVGKANDRYEKMIAKNRKTTFGNPRRVLTRISRIRGNL